MMTDVIGIGMYQESSTKRRPVVLLVEDEPAVRRSLQLVLQGSGLTVRSYATSAALLADPRASKADGVVADYRLPDGDGLSVLRSLRDDGFDGCAILVTGLGCPELIARAEKAGFQRILEKPLPERVLSKAVAELF